MNQSIVDDKNKTGYCKCKSFIIPLFSDSGRNDSLRFNPSFVKIFKFFFAIFLKFSLRHCNRIFNIIN